MRILWLSHLIPYPPKGGVLQRTFHLTNELCRNHDVDLIAFTQKDLLKNFNNGNIQKTIEESKFELGKNFETIKYVDIPADKHFYGKYLIAAKSLFQKSPYTINWLRSKKMEIAIKEQLERSDYDLVHIDTISLDIYRPLLGDIPLIMDHHNIESHMMIRRSKKEKNWMKKIYFLQEGLKLRAYEKKVCSNYSGHITCSDIDSKRLRKLTSGPEITDIPNGVDTKYFKSAGLKQNPYTIIFAGRMNWYPNVEAADYIVKEVFPLLKQRFPLAKLVLAGANPPQHLIKRSQENDGIQVTGFVDDIRPYIDQASVYVCPITDGGGTKLKILDALAMAKPIVASRIAAEGINVQDGKNIILADSPQEYVDAIGLLFESESRRSEMGIEARKLSEEKYEFSTIGEKLCGFYQKVIDRNRI
jgi:glycosyltransferase involved in cell wall biosynthesis